VIALAAVDKLNKKLEEFKSYEERLNKLEKLLEDKL
jgi:hypothetical protein